MSRFNKEWRVSQTSRNDLNNELYNGIDPILNPLIIQGNSRAYDGKLLIRELVDNLYVHNNAFSIYLEVQLNEAELWFKISHHGHEFDPFDPANNCHLIRGLKRDIAFNPNFSLTDSGKRSLTITFNLI